MDFLREKYFKYLESLLIKTDEYIPEAKSQLTDFIDKN